MNGVAMLRVIGAVVVNHCRVVALFASTFPMESAMKRVIVWLVAGAACSSGLLLGGCVVAPPRARVAVVAPAAVRVPGHWNRNGVWVAAHWRRP